MQPFSYARPDTIDEALQLGSQPGARYIGGGTNLIDLVKAGVEAPQQLVDVSRLPLAQVGLAIGPAVGLGGVAGMLVSGVWADRLIARHGHPSAVLRVPLVTLPLSVPFLAGFVAAPTLALTMVSAAAMTSACSTSASPTAAAAATP